MPRVSFHLLGVELVAFEISTTEPYAEPEPEHNYEVNSGITWAEPPSFGFTLPSTEWGDDDDDTDE